MSGVVALFAVVLAVTGGTAASRAVRVVLVLGALLLLAAAGALLGAQVAQSRRR